MTNEQYLVVSWFAAGTTAVLLAVLAWFPLRRGFADFVKALPARTPGLLLRRLFFAGLVLPALAGFFSVSFRSCNKDTYSAIVSDRAYLVAKTQEQVGTTLSHLAAALLVWAGILLAAVLAARRSAGDKSVSRPGAV